MWIREKGCFGSCLEFCLFCFFGVLFITLAMVLSPLFFIILAILIIAKLIMWLVKRHDKKHEFENSRKSIYCGMPCILTFSATEEYNLDNFSDLQRIPLNTGTTFTINGISYTLDTYLLDFAKACIRAGNEEYGNKIMAHLNNHGLFNDIQL